MNSKEQQAIDYVMRQTLKIERSIDDVMAGLKDIELFISYYEGDRKSIDIKLKDNEILERVRAKMKELGSIID